MDLHYIENIIMIYEEKSITKAAEKLFITQSALNQQLMKVETELGTPIFIRNRSDWQLTKAGEAYIASANAMLQMKKDTYRRILDIAGIRDRTIRIGLIPERGVDMFTSIYPDFHRRFPDALLEPIETNVLSMQKQISSGTIDLGLITLEERQKDQNIYLHMAEEEIFLAIPVSHPLACRGSRIPKEAPALSLSEFGEDPFVLIFQKSTMHEIEKKLFEEAGFLPHALFSTSSNLSKYRMVDAGVGCALIPAVFARPSEHIAYFRLPSRPKWEITMCHRQGAYLSETEHAFLQCCRAYWQTVLS